MCLFFILSISNNAAIVSFSNARANPCRVGKPGSKLAEFERDTWPELSKLASNVPEAGIHFQGQVGSLLGFFLPVHIFADAFLYNRSKDAGSDTGEWFAELMRADPWYKDVVPNVCPLIFLVFCPHPPSSDRKSTRLNSSHITKS